MEWRFASTRVFALLLVDPRPRTVSLLLCSPSCSGLALMRCVLAPLCLPLLWGHGCPGLTPALRVVRLLCLPLLWWHGCPGLLPALRVTACSASRCSGGMAALASSIRCAWLPSPPRAARGHGRSRSAHALRVGPLPDSGRGLIIRVVVVKRALPRHSLRMNALPGPVRFLLSKARIQKVWAPRHGPACSPRPLPRLAPGIPRQRANRPADPPPRPADRRRKPRTHAQTDTRALV